MNIPTNIKYTKDHEWVAIEDSIATIGITDFAQGELGDIVFVEFPEVGDHFNAGDTFGTIEAVKTVADLFAPVSGEVIAVNEDLIASPEKINTEPYGNGWITRVKMSNSHDEDDLMSSIDYEKHIG